LLTIPVLLIGVIACRLTDPAPSLPTDAPSPTALNGPTMAPIVTVTRNGGGSAVPTITATPCAADKASAIRYDIDAAVDVEMHTALTTLTATKRNDTDKPLDKIIMNIEPNRKPGVFTLTSLTSPDAAINTYTLTGPRLEIILKTPLLPDCEATFKIGFSVQAGQIAQSFIANVGYFGYTDRQFNLAEWLPEFAPHINGGFMTPDQWALGEYVVADAADYTATVKLRGKDAAKWEVIGPGEVKHTVEDLWQFTLNSARSFAISASPDFEKLSAKSDDGVAIDLYYFRNGPADKTPEPHAIPAAAKHALETTRTALNHFTKLYGRMPYKRLVVAEADFPDGMEFSGFVFVSKDWFAKYTGAPDAWLTLITAHEASHQWWYSAVGNDQGSDPFLDEGLALYNEVVFMEAQYPALVQWWWQFRVRNYTPAGKVDTAVYEYQNLREYINAVYLRGALMLQELREAIGDEAFFKWMRDYHEARNGKMATTTDFWKAMATSDYIKTEAIRAKYLKHANPLNVIVKVATVE
jgi:hypothetical protein